MIIPADKTPVRDLTLIGDCPKCGVPGLHKMPRRILICKLDEAEVNRAREEYDAAKRVYSRSWGYGYDYRESGSAERSWLEETRAEYHAARKRAERYSYLLLRECHSCDHQWLESLASFKSDHEALTLRERYPEGLVVFEGS